MSDSTVGPNGKLKDASEIVWYNDADDDQPIPSSSTIKSLLHPFFAGAAPPAAVIAGARRSTRAPRPSMRILDPDNIASSSTAQGKRKAADDLTRRRVARKIIASPTTSSHDGESDSDVDIGGTDLDAVGGDTEAEDDVERAYASTKAMGDADYVRTIFIKKDDYVDPHTGLVESGHVCTVCQ
ncbi:uncharacterized protein EDB91DRAFT_1088629 [Suillus paluster]|uniref:uncharacterized protein n=1 Tax=Suillus paluster TaxID=48578 RepID=UPI001B873329|nr:uncharacterized protein EDB91DRAFT_1088629 [Suillus paluster]KAG1720947.1 hypothetical protein EDB91DRAFT_1088629 [Suillus paluster]